MRRFSASSIADEQAQALHRVVSEASDPLAAMSDTQWFLYQARDTAFYTAFTRSGIDRDRLHAIVGDMVELAPQLLYYYEGAEPGRTATPELLDSITRIVEVDDFENYPDKVLDCGLDLYARPDIPLFRVTAYVRRGGADAEGRAAMVYVQASHALLEGADSASLTRSQSAAHGAPVVEPRETLLARIGWAVAAGLMTATMLGAAFASRNKTSIPGFRTVAISRQRLKRLAARLGVRQRSLYFALITYAINGAGPEKTFSARKINSAYTLLDSGTASVQADAFFRARAVLATFPWNDDFETYLRNVEAAANRAEEKDTSRLLRFVGKYVALQRRLSRVLPRLFGPRFWHFNVGNHLTMTMVPPHHAAGALGKDLVEPIHCGVWHGQTSVCTLTPGRRWLTLNFAMNERLLPGVDRILPLLEQLERRHGVAPSATTLRHAAAPAEME